MKSSAKEHSCCFTGHRKLPSGQLGEIRKLLKIEVTRLVNAGVNTFYSGFASGFDTESALMVNEMKKEYPHIMLIPVLPYRQEINVPYDECICIAETYRKGCFHIRNRFMVDHSSYCICYLSENKGGTFYTVNYAKKLGLEIHNINDKLAKKV